MLPARWISVAGPDDPPSAHEQQTVAARGAGRSEQPPEQALVERDRGDDASDRLVGQRDRGRARDREAREPAGDSPAADVDHESPGLPAREVRDLGAVACEHRALELERAGEVGRPRRGVVGDAAELVTRRLELDAERRVGVRLLVAESVRVEDPHRRDDGDPGDDEQAREQLQELTGGRGRTAACEVTPRCVRRQGLPLKPQSSWTGYRLAAQGP